MEQSGQLRALVTWQEQELQKLRYQVKLARQAQKKQNEVLAGLSKELRQLQTLFNLSNEVIFVLNEAGLCRQVSSSVTRQLGYNTREVLGHKLTGLIHPDDEPHLQTLLYSVLFNPSQDLSPAELRFQHKNGEWRYYEVGASNLLAGAHHGGIVLCCQDITDRKQLEEKLALTQRFLLEFDETLRPLTTEAELWDSAVNQLQTYFKLAGCYFVEVPDAEIDIDGQLQIHPLAVQEALREPGKGSAAFNALAGLLLDVSEQGGPITLEVAPDHPLAAWRTTPPPARRLTSRAAKTAARSMLLVPLFKEDQLALALVIEAYDGPTSLPLDDLALLQASLQHLWLSVQNSRLYRRGQQAAVLEERVRLARDLHDSLQQNLYAIQLSVDNAMALLQSGHEPARQHLQTALEYSLSSKTELHSLIFDLRPAALESRGLVAGLQTQLATLLNGSKLEITTNLAGEPPISIETKEALYWIGREVLNNIVKHSGASRIEVKLDWHEAPGRVRLCIADNGRGFNPAGSFPGHLGLQSMRERAARLGGTLNIDSAPGAGTCVEVIFFAATKI